MTTTSPATGIEFGIDVSDHPVATAERDRLLAAPGFGTVFTDHMVTLSWSAERGWHDGRLEPYGPLMLDPATQVFHYAQEIFEGLKAYRQAGGAIAAFRPWANAARFASSARRMAMPELPGEAFVQAIDLLVSQDRDWVPDGDGRSLYLRPFIIATQVGLGINSPSRSYLFALIASPAAAYFAGGIKPVTVWLSEQYTRAAPGGTGETKCGGNYAGSFAGQQQAVDHGCDQVVWLDAAERRWVEEMGGMNLFFVYGSGSDCPADDPGADRHAAARRHQGLAAHPRRRPRPAGGGGQDLGRLVAVRLPGRRTDRGVRLRHRRGDHPGRAGQVGRW